MSFDISQQPLVSIIFPVYNAGHFLLPAVRSIVFQTYTNWELLLIDDCSTDRALEDLLEHIQDPRIKIVKNSENRGVTARLNQGIDLAQGVFIARMDQDDISFPQRFERQVQRLMEDPELDLVSVGTILISPEAKLRGYYPSRFTHEEITAKPWNAFYLPHPTWMGRREWFKHYRYTTCLCEDQGLLLRAYRDSKFETIPEILFAYRLRDTFNFPVITHTRLSCLRQQIKLFWSYSQIHYVILSFCSFILKFGRDFVIYKLLGKSPILASVQKKLRTEDAMAWRSVSKMVFDKSV